MTKEFSLFTARPFLCLFICFKLTSSCGSKILRQPGPREAPNYYIKVRKVDVTTSARQKPTYTLHYQINYANPRTNFQFSSLRNVCHGSVAPASPPDVAVVRVLLGCASSTRGRPLTTVLFLLSPPRRRSGSGHITIIFSSVAGTVCVQRFEQLPSYTEVNPGQDALLVCKVFNKRGTCSWQKDNKVSGVNLTALIGDGRAAKGNLSLVRFS